MRTHYAIFFLGLLLNDHQQIQRDLYNYYLQVPATNTTTTNSRPPNGLLLTTIIFLFHLIYLLPKYQQIRQIW